MGRVSTALRQWLGGSPGEPTATTDGGIATEEGDGTPASESDLSLLSPESRTKADLLVETGLTPVEYVCGLLDAHDGRLRQKAVCEFTGWSTSSVSRTLSRMEEEGEVVRFRIGREKVVCLPDATPEYVSGAGDHGGVGVRGDSAIRRTG